MKGSNLAEAHKNDDLYDGNHGRYVLTMSPGQVSTTATYSKVDYSVPTLVRIPWTFCLSVQCTTTREIGR
jgi:hypothetical protein